MKLLESLKIGDYNLKNRILMAPLTRNRSDEKAIPNELMAEYYEQRSSAGLIISEATNISSIARAYLNTPGIWNQDQIEGWQNVTEKVHKKGGKIFLQLWHTGRISHPDFHNGEFPVAPSPISAGGSVFTKNGFQERVTPRELSNKEVKDTIQDYKNAAKNAIKAGFDGVEIHGANGYLIDQFICDGSNQRSDEYGGSIKNRIRFPLEIINEISKEIGNKKVGIRLSPSGTFNGMYDSNPKEVFGELIKEISNADIAYLHVMEPYSPPGKQYLKYDHYLQDREVTPFAREIYSGILISNSGYTVEEAEDTLQKGIADAIAFGRLFISNPDLPKRIMLSSELKEAEVRTYYKGGSRGYTDYAFLDK